MEVVIAKPSVVTEDMISVYDLVKDLSFEPSLLDEINIDTLQLHRRYEMLISRVVKRRVQTWVPIVVACPSS